MLSGSGGYNYSEGEFKSAHASTNNTLEYIVPIQAAGDQVHYDVEGTSGYNYGVSAASTTCQNLNDALNNTELHLPSGGEVIVHLDMEPNSSPLKSAYWAGWADTVHNYVLSGTEDTKPFIPGIYCPYWKNTDGKYEPATSVQTVFDNAYKYWTNKNVRCRGLWSPQPELCSYCTSGADVSADWSDFVTTDQTLNSGTVEVPLYLWQYAEYGNVKEKAGGCTYATTTINNVKITGCDVTDFAGQQYVDFGGSDSRGGEAYMFHIVS